MDKLLLERARKVQEEITILEKDLNNVQSSTSLGFKYGNGCVAYTLYQGNKDKEPTAENELFLLIKMYVTGDLQKRLADKKSELLRL